MKIVFVCAGNICRSPMAEALLKEKLARRGLSGVDVSSCGLAANPWNVAEPRLRLVIGDAYNRLNGFRSRPISEEIVRDADIVLAMEEGQVQEILSRFPQTGAKVRTLTSYAGQPGDIVDFIDGSHGGFLEWLKYCYSLENKCLDGIVHTIALRGPSP